MAGKQRLYRQRIESTSSLEKIFRAMELIAASRIGKARDKAMASLPYTRALADAVSAVASHVGASVQHPLLAEPDPKARVALLVLTADRGMAGAYNSGILRMAEGMYKDFTAAGRDVDVYVVGRRGVGYFDFHNRAVANSWVGQSDSPDVDLAEKIASELLKRFATADDGTLVGTASGSAAGVGAGTGPATAGEQGARIGELHVVYTHFKNMVSQEPEVLRLLPLQAVEVEVESHELYPLYDFEPSAHEALDALLPRYIRTRIFDCLLQSAASELAARQRAMHTATENAEDLIRNYTRLANQARQSEITQEISEIVSGADALAHAA